MIAINVSTTGIIVDGHAGYAEHGKDIVCAAVSVLTQNLINSIESLTIDMIDYEIDEGHIKIAYKDLSEKGCLLVDSFFIGISEIIRVYGEAYVQFI